MVLGSLRYHDGDGHENVAFSEFAFFKSLSFVLCQMLANSSLRCNRPTHFPKPATQANELFFQPNY